jgi:hypothetical protein
LLQTVLLVAAALVRLALVQLTGRRAAAAVAATYRAVVHLPVQAAHAAAVVVQATARVMQVRADSPAVAAVLLAAAQEAQALRVFALSNGKRRNENENIRTNRRKLRH